MSKRHNVPADLHRVASVAGTTAVVAESAAVAAEKAQEIANQAQELAVVAQEQVRSRRKGIVVVLLLGVLAVVGIVLWKRSQARGATGSAEDDASLEPLDLAAAAPA